MPSLTAVALCAAAATATLAAAAPPPPNAFNVEWRYPTAEPGADEQQRATYQGGMPLGNGRTTVLAWPNVTAGGIQFYLGRQDAMSDATELFRLGMVQVLVSPNPFTSTGVARSTAAAPPVIPYFNQTLDVSTGTLLVYAGGRSMADYGVLFTLYVDAHSDTVLLNVSTRDSASPSSAQFSLSVTTTSTRPLDGVWNYSVPFMCERGYSRPDVFLDPLPSGAGFQPGTLVQYHRNNETSAAAESTVATVLAQQGLSRILHTVPDQWTARQFGFALDAGHGPALQRTSPFTLASTAPASSFTVRLTTLSQQTPTASAWVTALAAAVQTQDAVPDGARRSAHEGWWGSFWARSYISVNQTAWPANNGTKGTGEGAWSEEASDAQDTTTSTRSPWSSVLPSAMPAGMALWLRADDLAKTQANGSQVLSWRDASGHGHTPIPPTWDKAYPPTFLSRAWPYNAMPAVSFTGDAQYLQGNMSLPEDKTVVALFMDQGSMTDCCSGVFYSRDGGPNATDASSNGLGTSTATDEYDDDHPDPGLNATVVQLDYSDSADKGRINVNGRPVIASATYSNTTTSLYVDGCLEILDNAAYGANATLFMIGSRNNAYGRYFKGLLAEVVVYPRALTDEERLAVESYLAAKWGLEGQGREVVCHTPPPAGWLISRQYALTRYLQAIQSRGHQWPLKFNGQAFTAAMGSSGEADYRDWGPSNWWQNTRLPYGAMLPAGDVDSFTVLLEYYLAMLPFHKARTEAYFGHSGIFFTETTTVFGAFAPSDYGCPGTRPAGFPVWLENSGYMGFDYGGDGGVPEVALAVLDYYLWTGNGTGLARYLPLATAAADFYRQHYKNRTAEGQYVIWPTQALETWWCEGWNITHNRPPDNCCVDDMPTVAGVHTLMEKLLALPPSFTTPAQRQEWAAFAKVLPPLPLTANGTQLAVARVLSDGIHNDEAPELYAVHPYRQYTVGRHLTHGLDLSPAITAFFNDSNAYGANQGWNQGVMNTALLGLTDQAAAFLIDRASYPPAQGYRFPAFMGHLQDYQPSADHLANMMAGLQLMLLQTADDGFGPSTAILLFPAWPCGWDVSAKLWAPGNTTVEITYEGGKVTYLEVQPTARAANIRFVNCVAGWA